MTNIESYEFNINDRMRSISTNAVQEARVAKGRGSLPFLDKDARIQHMIERLLHELTASADKFKRAAGEWQRWQLNDMIRHAWEWYNQ